MLQRRLLLTLGSLIALLLVGALSAILFLHDVLEDLVAAGSTAVEATARVHAVTAGAGAVQGQLDMLRRDMAAGAPDAPPAPLDVAVERLRDRLESLDGGAVLPEAALAARDEVRDRFDGLTAALDARAAALPENRAAPTRQAAAEGQALRAAAEELNRITEGHSRAEFERLVTKFRAAGVVVGIVSLILLNVSIVVVLRAATMVIRPVDRLVEASRKLAREEFDHRVPVDRDDEFGELARAYNALAEQLAENERRKLETLHQVARTLSHELNNAITTLELQLALMDRRSAGDQGLAEPLRHSHQSLARMHSTINSLARVRRIVLTDYLSGIKMLDLERSVEDDRAEEAAGAAAEIRPS